MFECYIYIHLINKIHPVYYAISIEYKINEINFEQHQSSNDDDLLLILLFDKLTKYNNNNNQNTANSHLIHRFFLLLLLFVPLRPRGKKEAKIGIL